MQNSAELEDLGLEPEFHVSTVVESYYRACFAFPLLSSHIFADLTVLYFFSHFISIVPFYHIAQKVNNG
jgi:hypothetical protein